MTHSTKKHSRGYQCSFRCKPGMRNDGIGWNIHTFRINFAFHVPNSELSCCSNALCRAAHPAVCCESFQGVRITAILAKPGRTKKKAPADHQQGEKAGDAFSSGLDVSRRVPRADRRVVTRGASLLIGDCREVLDKV